MRISGVSEMTPPRNWNWVKDFTTYATYVLAMWSVYPPPFSHTTVRYTDKHEDRTEIDVGKMW